MTCRNCRFLDVRPNAAGKIIPRKDNWYRCKVPLPEYEWPNSVVVPRPAAHSMGPDEGEGCKFWKLREKGGAK